MLMLPDKTTRCHRTGFQETCFKCVVEHGCKLWKRVAVVERNPETGAEIEKDKYDCLDSQQELFWKDMLRRQLQTSTTVDALRKEVHAANDVQMVGAIAHLNNRLNDLAAPDTTKLIEQQ